MKLTKKYAAVLAAAIAGSVFCGSLPAKAGGIGIDKRDIVFTRSGCDSGGCQPEIMPHKQQEEKGHMPQPHEPKRHRPHPSKW